MNPFVLLTAYITLASALTVNTPESVVTCEPLKFTWNAEGSKPPYYLSLVPASQPGAAALKQFPPQDGESYTWDKVDLPPNTSFTVSLKDGDGNQAFSAPATVQKGGNTNCANTDAVETSSSNLSSSSSTKVETAVAAATPSGSPTSSHAPVAAASSSYLTASPSTAPKTAVVSASSSNVRPSQSPSVKANSAAQDKYNVVVGIMGVLGFMSVVIFFVV